MISRALFCARSDSPALRRRRLRPLRPLRQRRLGESQPFVPETAGRWGVTCQVVKSNVEREWQSYTLFFWQLIGVSPVLIDMLGSSCLDLLAWFCSAMCHFSRMGIFPLEVIPLKEEGYSGSDRDGMPLFLWSGKSASSRPWSRCLKCGDLKCLLDVSICMLYFSHGSLVHCIHLQSHEFTPCFSR